MATRSDDTALDGDTTGRPTLVCPFCALLCDDLSPPQRDADVLTEPHRCALATAGFSHALQATEATPTIAGTPVGWTEAIDQARALLEAARAPLMHGLVGDLLDCSAALRLAERFGGVVDHRSGAAVADGLAVYQDSGWFAASLGEVRNRADLIVWIGADPDDLMPRLRQRLLQAADRLHTEHPPQVVHLDQDALEILDQVRVLQRARPLPNPDRRAVDLHEQILRSRYPVLVPLLKDHRFAEQVLRSAGDLVGQLNGSGRAALLMLATDIGAATALQASAWHCGFGLRTRFAHGCAEQDRVRFAAPRLLADQEVDLMVWFSSLSDDPPPACRQPTIAIGHPQMRFDGAPPKVFLPVAVPGVHRAGYMHRADGVHMLPLRAIAASSLPGTAQLVAQLLDADQTEGRTC